MLKFLVLVLIVGAVIAYFMLRQTPRRPPRDWRHGGDDGGPVLPASQVGTDAPRKLPNDTPSGNKGDPVSADAGNDGGGDGGGD